ncbi:T9SS type A sorting domain-containing protein [Hymenobacter sp. 15J16-1T3B]|uniref:T9SS type A sorting domain-containing protein n=1 Tax=Hymenobacter sp. 15J16-1T3B TaxID=2886941 RepID=UPI001D11B5EC|nr:T9SS type A sorting domain-containing protein [Hymenobacter sp. 15J16-1T3B]MCC3156283.1 T9SS type A sorting domain-containing protein [Hymenobacter sp. 15J16-1T3B]
MRKPVLLTIQSVVAGGLCLLAGAAQAQTPDWQTAVALAGDVQVQASTADANGNVYLAGGFAGIVTLGGTTLSTTNGQEIFVAKWNPNTGFAWALQATTSGSGRNQATAIAVAPGYVYVAGNFVGPTLTLGSRPTLTNAQGGTSDIFLARVTDFGTSGTVSWAKRAGGTANDYATSLSNYASTYLYLGGSTGGSATFDSYTLPGSGGFVARYYASAPSLPVSPAPVVRAGDNVTALQVFGNFVYAAGTFTNAANTMPGGPLTSDGGEDVFALKLDYFDVNTQYWAQRAGGTGDDYARSLTTNGSSVYVGGSYRSASAAFGGTTLTNAGAANLFVSKLTDAGSSASWAWALQNGGTSTSPANSINGLGVYGSSVYAAGEFAGTASFGSRSLTSAGGTDVVVAKITDAGASASFVGGQQAGGAGADYASALGRLDSRTWFAAGQVATPAAFGTGFSIGTNAGSRPGYVALLSDPAPLLTLAAPNAGLAGSTVTLYGQGLTGTTAITFAGSGNNVVTSGFTVNAAGTQISGVVVPAGAQSGQVNVTTASGSSNGLVNYTVLTSPNPAPEWQNAQVVANASLIRWAAPLPNGAVVVAGEFSGSITLGSTTLTSAGGLDVFVAKFNPATGTYTWAVRAGAAANEDVFAGVAVSGSNIYLAGQFTTQSISFGNTTLTATSAGPYNGYVAKLTDAGSSASWGWAQLLDDNSGVFVEALTATGNNVYVGGDFTGPSLTVGNRTVSGNVSQDDGYVARLTDNGSSATCNWIKTVGSPDGSTVNVYGLSATGSTVYLSAVLYGSVSFGTTTVTAAGSSGSASSTNDIAVARLIDGGTSADFAGALRAGGIGSEFPVGLTAGPSGTVYVSGRTNSSSWTGATLTGTGSGFVMKVVDTNGALSVGWVQLLNTFVNQLAVNGTGIYAATTLVGTETYGGTTLRSAGGSDGLVVRLTDNGSSPSISWARAAGGLGGDSFRALALSGNQVVVGGTATPLAAFGSLVVSSPAGVTTAALGVLNDPLLLATAAPGHSRPQLALYPNPARTQVTMRLPAGAAAQPTLLDALGREVRRYPASGKAEAVLDLRGLPAGVYVLRCGPVSQRLIVE